MMNVMLLQEAKEPRFGKQDASPTHSAKEGIVSGLTVGEFNDLDSYQLILCLDRGV